VKDHALLAPAGPLAIGLAAAIAAAALGIPQRAPRYAVAVVAIVLLAMILSALFAVGIAAGLHPHRWFSPPHRVASARWRSRRCSSRGCRRSLRFM